MIGYFEPGRAAGRAPAFSGSRFEFLAGGGDRPDTADRITYDDLVAVTTLSVDIPGDVAIALLEGQLGDDVAAHLRQIPTDLSIANPAASAALDGHSSADVLWSLLEEQRGMGWVLVAKLLARKRPRLLPVYDNVVRCALGSPSHLWLGLHEAMTVDGGALHEDLLAARRDAGVSDHVTALRVLDVIVWRRHRPGHLQHRCPSPDRAGAR